LKKLQAASALCRGRAEFKYYSYQNPAHFGPALTDIGLYQAGSQSPVEIWVQKILPEFGLTQAAG